MEPNQDDDEARPDGAEADTDDDLDDEELGPSRTTLLIGAAVAFVAIALVGILVATSGGGDGDGGGRGGDDQAEVGDNRTDVGVFGTIDDFEGADSADSLGTIGEGEAQREWEAQAGVWGIEDGKARVYEPNVFEDQAVRNHAVIGLGQGDGAVQVRMDTVTPQAGLVFRYRGPYNFWMVVASPRAVTWNIYKVVDGEQELMGNTGQSPVADGTTIAVRMEGETIEVIINGRVRKTIVDDFQRNDGKVGLTTTGEEAVDTRFDDFHAALPGGNPLTPLDPDAAPTATTGGSDGGGGGGSTPTTAGGGP